MALEPILWALHDSPVNSTTDRMLLAGLAEKADPDGTNAFPSRRTLARIALCDVKTVQRRLAALTERGVITLGNQEAARYIPAHARPKVYDLQIPASWYGPQRLARVNEDRAHRGLPPLTNDSRPLLAPAPPRTERSDKGRPRHPAGDSQSPPPQHAEPDGRGDSQSRGRGDCHYPEGGLPVPQPSPLTLPSQETPAAPAARSADDARRATTGSSAHATGGCAAPTGAKAPTPPAEPSRRNRERVPAGQAEAVKAVEAGWPRELSLLLPPHRPAVLREAILQALDQGRTPQQLTERIGQRWWAHGYARALAEGQLASPVGVAVALVRPSTDCPDPMCEDGITLHLGHPCPKCTERRADRRRGRVPAQRNNGPTLQWWECQGNDCSAAGRGRPPEDGLCQHCQAREEHKKIQNATAHLLAETQTAQEAERLRHSIRWERMLNDAYTQHAEYTRTEQDHEETKQRAAATAAETHRLRQQLLRQHPELAPYTQHQP
ncbi:hypothetical protein Slala05_73070 [Streptomyces lavendulae subsp. lavendulae]|nr:hypothetical protein Slala05_73070 [Streptomyces lavendulae subsp. lavendulae]